MDARQDSNIPWTSLVITTLVLLGLLLNRPSLEVGRPVKDVPAGEIPVPNAVYARLWQDPLSAVKSIDGVPRAPSDSGTVDETSRLEFQPDDRIVLIPVLVPGTPFSESEEQRIRMRYAVHAGLAFAGFMPKDSDRLRFLTVSMEAGGKSTLAVPYEWFSPDVVGAVATPSRALVLWIDEHALFTAYRNAVVGVCNVLSAIVDGLQIPAEKVTIRAIGPDSSDSLMRLCTDLDRLHERWVRWSAFKAEQRLADTGVGRDQLELGWKTWWELEQAQGAKGLREGGGLGQEPGAERSAAAENRAKVRPPASSAALFMLFEGADSSPDGPDALLRRGIPKITFYAARPTAPYNALRNALAPKVAAAPGAPSAAEAAGTAPVDIGAKHGWIKRTGGDSAVGDGRYDHFTATFRSQVKIVRSAGDDEQLVNDLIAELDARGVLASWQPDDRCVIIRERETFFGRRIGDAVRDAMNSRGIDGDAISFLGYERGLDGEISGGGQQSPPARPGTSATDLAAAAGAVLGTRFRERAESRGQIDYFRRAAEHLQDTSHVRVVVIVGTDVYDKLILLRAFRPILDDCVFLTTDLDARLLHRDEAEFTRNLIVASHYGLVLASTSPLPPFRDTYQTAVFDATLRVLDVNEAKQLEAASKAWSITTETLQAWFRDRTRGMYEIGRRSAHRLAALDIGAPRVTDHDDAEAVVGAHEAEAGKPVEASPSVATPTSATHRLGLAAAAAGSIALSLGATLAAAWLASRQSRRLRGLRTIAVRALPIVGVCAAVGPWWFARDVGAEPVALVDGVNIKVAVILQMCVTICASWFLAGGRGIYSEQEHPEAPWRLAWWGLVPFAVMAGLAIAAGAWGGFGLIVSDASLWMVRSESLRWAALISFALAMGSVAALAGVAFACCRRAVEQVRQAQESAPSEPATVRSALTQAEALARGADRMALQVSQVVMILIVSMLPVFERWPIHLLDVVIPVLAGLLALVAAGRVTSAGTALRDSILHRIRERLFESPDERGLKAAAQIIADRGAAQQPIHRRLLLTALALPLGGISLIQILPLLLGR